MAKVKDWLNSKVEVKESSSGGKGMFATSPLEEGETVVIWKGTYTNREKAEEAKRAGKLIMQWDDDLFSVEERGDSEGYFINHSCDSNLWMKDAYTLVTKRPIATEEELTADCALWEADENFVSSWSCSCGSPYCRGKVTGKDWRKLDVQGRYKDHFSPLINTRIAGKN